MAGIDTSKVPVGTRAGKRRALRFGSIDDMMADARALAAAPRLEQLGNWPIGRALNHIAAWIEYPYAGYPPDLVIPEEMQARAGAIKQRMMRSPMPAGERLPGLAAGTLATEDVPADAGLGRLEWAAAYLRGDPAAPAPHPDPAFGIVTRREWSEISLRHAELHLSFYRP